MITILKKKKQRKIEGRKKQRMIAVSRKTKKERRQQWSRNDTMLDVSRRMMEVVQYQS